MTNDEKKISYINLDASNTFIGQQKWQLFSIVKISPIASYDLPTRDNNKNQMLYYMKHLKLCATCFCARKPGYYISNAIFLISLITLCSLTLFAIDPKLPHNRFQSTITLILTSISFKWVINRSLPAVSYLTSLDKYASINILYLFFICVWHAIVGSFWEIKFATKLDRIMLGVFSFIFFLIQFIYALWMRKARGKVHELEKENEKFLSNLNNVLSHTDLFKTKKYHPFQKRQFS